MAFIITHSILFFFYKTDGLALVLSFKIFYNEARYRSSLFKKTLFIPLPSLAVVLLLTDTQQHDKTKICGEKHF